MSNILYLDFTLHLIALLFLRHTRFRSFCSVRDTVRIGIKSVRYLHFVSSEVAAAGPVSPEATTRNLLLGRSSRTLFHCSLLFVLIIVERKGEHCTLIMMSIHSSVENDQKPSTSNFYCFECSYSEILSFPHLYVVIPKYLLLILCFIYHTLFLVESMLQYT